LRRNNYTKRCLCPCNKELPPRYKGREKIYYDGDKCRKIWKKMSSAEQEARKAEMKEDIKKELSRKQ